MHLSTLRLLVLFVLFSAFVVPSARAAERPIVLLYGFSSSAPAAPEVIPGAIAIMVRDELEKGGKFSALVRNGDDPNFRRLESEQPGADPTRLHQALRVGRSLGARYVVQGVVTAYEAPVENAPGKITFRLTTASTGTDVSRDVFVTAPMKAPGRGASAATKVLGPAARAVATTIATEAIPALERATPADREQAAARARARGTDATAGGATQQAVEELRRAARLTPEDAATHLALGEALVKQGLQATALLEFRQALDLQEAEGAPAESTRALRLRLVRALGERGLWDEAQSEARRGLAAEPTAEPLRLALAEAAIRVGDGAAALEALQPLQAARAPRAEEWNLLAEAQALTGDAPRWLDAVVRGALVDVSEAGQYAAVIRRLDQAFRALSDEAGEAERRVLVGQLAPGELGKAAVRRGAQARVVTDYLQRLAFPPEEETAHHRREAAWSDLARAADQARLFAEGGNYEDLAAARARRLQAEARLPSARGK
jgi:Flp pilus assembly protein TadD